MGLEFTKTLKSIEDNYVNWLGSTDLTRKQVCEIEGQNITLVFNQGHWTYEKSNKIPTEIKDTINVASNDPRVQNAFKDALQKISEEGDYQFKKGAFKLRFFKDVETIERKIAIENEKFLYYQQPQTGLFANCVIL